MKMKFQAIETIIFVGASGTILLLYFALSFYYNTKPELQSAILIVVSAASLAGAFKVIVYSFQRTDNGIILQSDLLLGSSMLVGAISLIWFSVTSVAVVFSNLPQ